MFGFVNYYSPRGFGFLRISADAEDVFFHVREFCGPESQLIKGLKVEFDTGMSRGKPCARNIRPLPEDKAGA